MKHAELTKLLVGQHVAEGADCLKLSAHRFVHTQEWEALKQYQQDFLRCYAVGASSLKSVLVGRSAAKLLDMWTIPAADERVELALVGGKAPSKSEWLEGTMFHHMRVPEMDLWTVPKIDAVGVPGDIRLTTPVRTAVDIARFHGYKAGVVAMDGLMQGLPEWKRRELWHELSAVVKRLAGKRGIGEARKALSLVTNLSESPYESLLRMLLHEAGIHVELQMWIGRYYRADMVWGKVVAEVDGLQKFEDTPHDEVLKQLKRDNWMREQGYEVLRFYVLELLFHPEKCIRRILEAKARSEKTGPVLTPATRRRP